MQVIPRTTDDAKLVQIVGIATREESIEALSECLREFYRLRPAVIRPEVRVKLHDPRSDGPIDNSFVMVEG